MKNETKTLFYACFFSFLSGCICAGSVAFGINLHRSRLNRAEIAGLNEQIAEDGERIKQYSAEIGDERRRIMGLRDEVAAGLEECRDIRDATQRIRKQVEILAKYYTDSECSTGSGNTDNGSDDSELGE